MRNNVQGPHIVLCHGPVPSALPCELHLQETESKFALSDAIQQTEKSGGKKKKSLSIESMQLRKGPLHSLVALLYDIKLVHCFVKK